MIGTSATFGRYGKVAAPHGQQITAWDIITSPFPKPPFGTINLLVAELRYRHNNGFFITVL